ncbi:MAG TPA: HepT-like ribonuclease domain-containing protein [Rhizomicrobium sp.]|nr:HepT-like ribonuclease domain-containing protein [Rhizomicrobium sp.]
MDIAESVEKIDTFLAGQPFEVFRTNALIHDAVVRNLEIVSEASRHIPQETKAKAPEIPWREIADFGNVLRHGYEGVNDPILWSTIKNDLPVPIQQSKRFSSIRT